MENIMSINNEQIKNIDVIIKVKTGEQDKVFGTVSSKQI